MSGVNYNKGCHHPPSDTDINLSKLIFLILKSLIIPFVKIQSILCLTLLFNESINISISMFPGDVGGLRNNIDRWRNQIGLKQFDPQNSINLNQKISPEEDIQNITLPLLGNAQMVHLNNNENNKSIKVIVIPNQNGQTIFVKMNGNINGVLELENDFSLFYQSIYWGN